MRILLPFMCLFWVSNAFAQKDSVVAGVYSWNKAGQVKSDVGDRKQFLEGSSKDLTKLEIHTLTLQPRQSASGVEIKTDAEKLIIVKEGYLTIDIKDSSGLLGPGSYAVIPKGYMHGFKNVTGIPVTYYSLSFTSRAPANIQRGNEAGGFMMKDWNELVARQTDKGESRPIFDRPSSMFAKFDMHATALNPGMASHDPHRHRAEEIILMIKGEVQVQLDQKFLQAASGDVIFYPAYSLHAVKNTGNTQCGYFAIQWRNE